MIVKVGKALYKCCTNLVKQFTQKLLLVMKATDVMDPSINSNQFPRLFDDTFTLISPSSSCSMAADVYLDCLIASFPPSFSYMKHSWMLKTSPIPWCGAFLCLWPPQCAASRVWLCYHVIRLPVFHRLVSKLNVLHQWWSVVSSSLCSCYSALAPSSWWSVVIRVYPSAEASCRTPFSWDWNSW